MDGPAPTAAPGFSPLKLLLRGGLRGMLRPFLSEHRSVAFQRRWTDFCGGATTFAPRGCSFLAERLGGLPLTLIEPATAAPDRHLLFLHGGGYVVGSARSHRNLAAHLGHAAGAHTWLPEYRLAPEHPYPAALDDALAAYRALLAKGRVVVAGDSAGGGLALSLALALREQKLPQPAALLLLSPWVDLTLSGESMRTRNALDPLLTRNWLSWCANQYTQGRPRHDPHFSPLFTDLRGLAPMLIHVGSDEILLSDAQRLHDHARASGGSSQLRVFPGMWHDFQLHASLLRESDESLAELGRFAGDIWSRGARAA